MYLTEQWDTLYVLQLSYCVFHIHDIDASYLQTDRLTASIVHLSGVIRMKNGK